MTRERDVADLRDVADIREWTSDYYSEHQNLMRAIIENERRLLEEIERARVALLLLSTGGDVSTSDTDEQNLTRMNNK